VYNIIGGFMALITYEHLWIKDLTTYKVGDLKETLNYYFKQNVAKNMNKSQIIEKIENEKKKREKTFSLVLETDNREKKYIPVPLFKWQDDNGNISNSTYLSEIDNFTVQFDSKKDIIRSLTSSLEIFEKEDADILKEYLENDALGYLDLKIILNDKNISSKYEDFIEVVLVDNIYLRDFLSQCKGGRKYGFKPIYSYDSQYFNYNIILDFSNQIQRNDNFKEYCLKKLDGSIWPYNKTFQSGAIKDFCNYGGVNNQIIMFRKYKNIRIASILLNEYEKILYYNRGREM
jgi:hypothetical protein